MTEEIAGLLSYGNPLVNGHIIIRAETGPTITYVCPGCNLNEVHSEKYPDPIQRDFEAYIFGMALAEPCSKDFEFTNIKYDSDGVTFTVPSTASLRTIDATITIGDADHRKP